MNLCDLRAFAVNLCRSRCGCLGDFAIDCDRRVRTDQRTNSTPRASIFECVRGVVAFGGKPGHVQLHHLLWTCTQAQLAAFTVCIADFDPTFCRHWHSFSEKFDKNKSVCSQPDYVPT